MLYVHIFSSLADFYGNSYTAFTVSGDTGGRVFTATITGGPSNVNAALLYLFGDWEKVRAAVRVTESMETIRRFNAETRDAPDAGCRPEQIGGYIRDRFPAACGVACSPVSVFVQCFNAGNDVNGNSRCVWLAYGPDGQIIDAAAHGVRGTPTARHDHVTLVSLPGVRCSVREYREHVRAASGVVFNQ